MKDSEINDYWQFVKTCIALSFLGLLGIGVLAILVFIIKLVLNI
jgi:hypothetical protein